MLQKQFGGEEEQRSLIAHSTEPDAMNSVGREIPTYAHRESPKRRFQGKKER